MGYKMSKYGMWEIKLEKYTEPKGFFRNTAGPLKIGEICLVVQTNGWDIRDFLTENDEIYYAELGCVKIPGFTYQGETPRISIGDKENIVPAEDRIKFMFEALDSNENYNRLTIKRKDPNSGGYFKSLYEIAKTRVQYDDVDDLIFYINEIPV